MKSDSGVAVNMLRAGPTAEARPPTAQIYEACIKNLNHVRSENSDKQFRCSKNRRMQ